MWALIFDGEVAEITDIDPEGRYHPDFVWIACEKNTQVGMLYKDNQFVGKQPVDVVSDIRSTMSLSAADARLRLAELGLLDRINDAIDAMPKSTPLRIKWEYSPVLHRADPVLDDFCHGTLGMTDEQIDELFVSTKV